MKPKTYKYVERLIKRISRKSQSLNDSFTYYRRTVVLQSCMRDFCVVIVTETDDRHFGNTLEFDVDFDTMKVRFQSTQCRKMTDRVIETFKYLYGAKNVRFSYDEINYKDEQTIQPKLPI